MTYRIKQNDHVWLTTSVPLGKLLSDSESNFYGVFEIKKFDEFVILFWQGSDLVLISKAVELLFF